MNSDATNPKLIERQEVRTRQGATLEVVRIKLTAYARGALGVQVHSIPAASPASEQALPLSQTKKRAAS